MPGSGAPPPLPYGGPGGGSATTAAGGGTPYAALGGTCSNCSGSCCSGSCCSGSMACGAGTGAAAMRALTRSSTSGGNTPLHVAKRRPSDARRSGSVESHTAPNTCEGAGLLRV
jgi:hypothetical protein